METAVIIRGKIAGPRRIELDEAVTGIEGAVEVMVRSIATITTAPARDVFDLIASLAPGTRSKEDIDRQVAEDRSSWGDR